jgi:nitrate reductase gamma subunit
MLSNSRDRKYSYFLIATIGCIIILSIPLIYGHFFHSGHLFHIAIHESGFALATFLTAVAIISYKKTKIKRMLFSAAAFGVLAFGQAGYMYSKIGDHTMEDMSSPSEILDICIVIMTVLFAIGVFYKK